MFDCQTLRFDPLKDLPESFFPDGFNEYYRTTPDHIWNDRSTFSKCELDGIGSDLLYLGYSFRLAEAVVHRCEHLPGSAPRATRVCYELFPLWWGRVTGNQPFDPEHPQHLQRWNQTWAETEKAVSFILVGLWEKRRGCEPGPNTDTPRRGG